MMDYLILSALAAAALCLANHLANISKPDVDVPYGIPFLRFTPRWLSNTMYAIDAVGMIEKGYKRFRDRPFKLIRSDVNMVVIPPFLVEELASLTIDVASGIKALERDLLGRWTGLHIIIQSRLHYQVVQRRLNPHLRRITASLEDEVRSAVDEYFPTDSSDWLEIQPYHVLLKVSARISSRILVGFPICRDPRWIDVAINFTENIFESIVIMRCFPPWTYRALGYLLPSCWRSVTHIKTAHDILGPAFAEQLARLDKAEEKGDGGEGEDPPDGFHWLADIASGHDRDPIKLAHYEVLLALASIHTTLLREVNVLYDLMSNRQYIEGLRQEIEHVRREPWDKDSYTRLSKMDSVLRESQRMNPPTSIGLRRIMQQPYTLADGTFLPKGAYVCAPTYAIENDEQITSRPEVFDGLRSHDLRGEKTESNKHRFTTTEASILGFGHGRTACPGRHFASLALKAIMIKLLTEYDFEYPPGQTERPENLRVHEFVFPKRGDKVLVRRRHGHFAPF